MLPLPRKSRTLPYCSGLLGDGVEFLLAEAHAKLVIVASLAGGVGGVTAGAVGIRAIMPFVHILLVGFAPLPLGSVCVRCTPNEFTAGGFGSCWVAT